MFDYISKFTNESIELEHIIRSKNKYSRLKDEFFYLYVETLVM